MSGLVRDRLEDLIKEIETGEAAVSKTVTPPKAPKEVKKQFFSKTVVHKGGKGQVEFETFGYGKAPDGKKHYFTPYPKITDKNILKDVPSIDILIKPDLNILLTVLLAVERKKTMLLFGEPGTGKTTYVKLAAALLGFPYLRMSGMEGIEVADIVGQVGIKNGDTAWEDGDLAHAVRHGYLVADEEPFKNSAGVNMAKQSLNETDARVLKLVGNHEERDLVAHDWFRIIACDNVRGTGDGADQMAATTIQDASSINRLEWKQHVGYLPAKEEVEMTLHRYPDLTPEFADKMVKLGNLIRKAWRTGTVEPVWSVRQLMAWADDAVYLQDAVRSFDKVYFSGLNDEEKTVVQRLWSDVGFFGQPLK